MQVTNHGIDYRIIDGGTKFLESLPPKVYSIHFHKMMGYWLSERKELSVGDFKIYGNTPKRVEKVFRTFGMRDRNLGILLSGKKGMGKSVFMRHMAEESVRRGFPVIVVNENIPGIAEFISKIEQECVVLFDEFEKIFLKDGESEDDQQGGQTQFLSLFDGMDSGKKLFVIAINDTYRLSEFFINRPGRFYYHFCFEYLEENEVREYCVDNLKSKDVDTIDKLAVIAKFHDINYDILSAIVTELNNGYTLKESVNDLNIDINENQKYYDFEISIDGIVLTGSNWVSDRGCNEEMYIYLSQEGCRKNNVEVYFSMDDVKYDNNASSLYIPIDKLSRVRLCNPFGNFTSDDSGDDIDIKRCSRLTMRPHEFNGNGTLDYMF